MIVPHQVQLLGVETDYLQESEVRKIDPAEMERRQAEERAQAEKELQEATQGTDIPTLDKALEQAKKMGVAQELIEAGVQRRQELPKVLLPLAMVNPSLEEGRGGLNRAVAAARSRLGQAEQIGRALQVSTRTLLRLDEDIAGGMSRTAIEKAADLLLIRCPRPAHQRAGLEGGLVGWVGGPAELHD